MHKPTSHRRVAGALTALALATGLLGAAPPAAAQAPGVVGIDHVGINVPDLDQAVAFFRDTFGFTAVTRLGPFPLDAAWKKTYRIHADAGTVSIAMLRAGDGANIELFAYSPASGSREQPHRDDLAASHVALYTSDIAATKAYLESKGIKFLSGVNSGGGDTEGESWVYFETPWGATFELNSYPHGKGYEKHAPAVSLWTAGSSVQLTDAVPTAAQLRAVAAQQVAIWNDTDAASRQAKMAALYTPNVAFFDPEGAATGLSALDERIARLQREHPGFQFSAAKIDSSRNVVRYYWRYGPRTQPARITGMDLFVLEQGKVRSVHVFVDAPARQATHP